MSAARNETDTPRVALVTGGGSGIGKAIVERLAVDGHRVATLDLVPGDGPYAYTADVTDRAQIDTALQQIRAELGRSVQVDQFSALKKDGVDKARRWIAGVLQLDVTSPAA